MISSALFTLRKWNWDVEGEKVGEKGGIIVRGRDTRNGGKGVQKGGKGVLSKEI